MYAPSASCEMRKMRKVCIIYIFSQRAFPTATTIKSKKLNRFNSSNKARTRKLLATQFCSWYKCVENFPLRINFAFLSTFPFFFFLPFFYKIFSFQGQIICYLLSKNVAFSNFIIYIHILSWLCCSFFGCKNLSLIVFFLFLLLPFYLLHKVMLRT